MKLKFRFFSSRVHCPQKWTLGSAGYDLLSSRNIILETKTTQRIPIVIGFCFLNKYFTKIYSCSNLSLCSVECGGGVIDSDFGGNVNVILHNHSHKQVELETGYRIS